MTITEVFAITFPLNIFTAKDYSSSPYGDAVMVYAGFDYLDEEEDSRTSFLQQLLIVLTDTVAKNNGVTDGFDLARLILQNVQTCVSVDVEFPWGYKVKAVR